MACAIMHACISCVCFIMCFAWQILPTKASALWRLFIYLYGFSLGFRRAYTHSTSTQSTRVMLQTDEASNPQFMSIMENKIIIMCVHSAYECRNKKNTIMLHCACDNLSHTHKRLRTETVQPKSGSKAQRAHRMQNIIFTILRAGYYAVMATGYAHATSDTVIRFYLFVGFGSPLSSDLFAYYPVPHPVHTITFDMQHYILYSQHK